MKAKLQDKWPTPAHAQMDSLLMEMGELKAEVDREQAEAEASLARAKEFYRDNLVVLKKRAERLHKQILSQAKKRRDQLFDGKDLVDLPHGILLHQVKEQVKKAAAVLAKLEEYGLEEGLHREVSVNWEVLESWPDEKLLMVGTERVRKELFAYELKGNYILDSSENK